MMMVNPKGARTVRGVCEWVWVRGMVCLRAPYVCVYRDLHLKSRVHAK